MRALHRARVFASFDEGGGSTHLPCRAGVSAADAFLANDRTLADPEVIRSEPAGRIRLRLINGASATQFWIDLGALTGTVVAVDGHAVRPLRSSRLPLAMAQRSTC